MANLFNIKNFLKLSFGVNVKVHISHQKKFCKDSFQIYSVPKFRPEAGVLGYCNCKKLKHRQWNDKIIPRGPHYRDGHKCDNH